MEWQSAGLAGVTAQRVRGLQALSLGEDAGLLRLTCPRGLARKRVLTKACSDSFLCKQHCCFKFGDKRTL